jgi:serine/threonine-protein kinase
MRPQVGLVINNKYRLVRLIGDGGMGSVYEARHEVLGTTVALKFLHPELSRRSGLVQRFLQEARVSAAIRSPHVVRVSDVDQTSSGLAYIVLEYLEGKTLQTLYEDLYHAGQRLAYADALEYTMQILEGVEAAHEAGIVHRDLKPDNVMITKGLKGESLIKVLDFGIAKLRVTGELDKGLTRPGVIMGTPEYMAPEQAYSADAVDARADIFSLGVMVFEMLAGRRPVGGDDPHQIAGAYLAGQVAKLTDLAPHVPAELAAAVHKAMAPLAKDRFDSVADLRAAIAPFLPAHVGATPSPLAVTPAPAQASPAQVSPAQVSPAQVSPATPPTNAPGDEAPRAVPKTLPPEDDAPPSPGLAAEPDAFAGRGPAATPLGGFDAREPSSPALTPMAAPGSDPAVSPVPAYGVGGTSSPVAGGYPAPPQRPGGTDIAQRPFGESNDTANDAPVPAAVRAYASGTAMDPGASMPAPVANRKKKRGGFASFVLIVLFAGGIASAVVGGLYVAQEYGRHDDAVDDPGPVATAVTSPSAVLASTAPPPDVPVATTPITPTSPPPPAVTQTSKPPVSHPTTPPQPTSPPAVPTTPAQPQPTSPTRPPFVLPSALPTINFPLPGLPPFMPPSQPTTPAQPQPTTPPAQPQPSTTTTTKPRPPVIIHIPKKGGRRVLHGWRRPR